MDGSGGPGRVGGVAVSGDRIAAVFGPGPAPEGLEAAAVVDASGLAVAPGFIDVHTHADLAVLRTPGVPETVAQGVTTIVVGQCGLGLAPLSRRRLMEMARLSVGVLGELRPEPDWATVSGYRSRVEAQGLAPNIAYLVPHGALRAEAIGFGLRPADEGEIQWMRALCEEAMGEGAVGLSTGLTYAPCVASTTDELVEIARGVGTVAPAAGMAGPAGAAPGFGFVAIHLRRARAGADFLEPVREAFEIARRAGVAVHLNHYRPRFQNAGQASRMLEAVDRARSEGLDITIETYPYTMGAGGLHQHLPPWVQEGTADEIVERLGDSRARAALRTDLAAGNVPNWGAMMISAVGSDRNRRLEGQSVEAAARAAGKDAADFACDLLIDERLYVSVVRTPGAPGAEERSEEDIREVLSHPACMVASDSLYLPGRPHPRTFGTFPRYLGLYVRGLRLASLPEGIRKCTALPAARLGLKDRGVIRKGAFADLVVFDPERIIDRASLGDEGKPSAGIEHVLVNGRFVLRAGKPTGALPGRWLRQ